MPFTRFQRIPELKALLKGCLREFPEVRDREIRGCNTGEIKELGGAIGSYGGKRTIFLFIPNKLWNLDAREIVYDSESFSEMGQ